VDVSALAVQEVTGPDAGLHASHRRPPQKTPLKLLNSQTLHQLRDLLSYLPAQRLRGLAVLLAVSLVLGLFDLVFIGLLARLVGALSGSRLADRIPQILVFGGNKADQGIWIAALVIALVWLSMALRYGASLIQSFLSAQIWADYGNRIYANVLLQPYEYFQTQNTAHLLARLNRILGRISDDLILPLLTVVSNALSVAVLTLGIVVSFGWPALLIFAFLFGAYTLSSQLIAPPLRFAAKQKLNFSLRVNSLLMESTRSIRDVQLYGAESYYLERFEAIGVRGKKYDRLTKLLPEIPRYVIEPAGITVLFAVGLLPALLQGDSGKVLRDALPALAAIMFAALKLSAPIQAIFRSVNKLRGGLPDISDALMLLELKPRRRLRGDAATPTPSGVLPRTTIRLDQVWYRYPQSADWVMRGVSLSVPVGSRVALVGATGGGKTTAAHLLLGLLQPQQGSLLLDGIPVTSDELPAWQACCAIVPQNIALLDASIRSNVAFGIDDHCIEDDRVWEALEMAQLDDFVAELPYGFYTVVGEDGMRLSGGQRQRLALARAFYKRAKVLILDEATSALDNKTENDVLEALELVGRRCTTVVIAHRLSTIRYCDRIFEFEKGRVKASGTYQLLQERSDTFRQLVALQDG
jgi:ATP-binding cassette subfamily B protein